MISSSENLLLCLLLLLCKGQVHITASPVSSFKYTLTEAIKVPNPRTVTSSIYDPATNAIYIFAGLGTVPNLGYVRDIMRFNVRTGTLTQGVGWLPYPMGNGATGTDGNGKIIYFEEYSASSATFANGIYEFLPEAKWPSPSVQWRGALTQPGAQDHISMTTASDGSGSIYIVEIPYLRADVIRIRKLNTNTYQTTVVGYLSKGFITAVASWVKGSLWIFGSLEYSNGQYPTVVVKIAPTGKSNAFKFEYFPGILEEGLGSTVVVNDEIIYMVGGSNKNDRFRLSKFNTTDMKVEELFVDNFESALLVPAPVYVKSNNRIYICGGEVDKGMDYWVLDGIHYIQLP